MVSGICFKIIHWGRKELMGILIKQDWPYVDSCTSWMTAIHFSILFYVSLKFSITKVSSITKSVYNT